ncbi:MAG: flagellar biosynthesis protein FlhA [Gammaproteobacteria bacterium]|nr:flagellar biosynthesis protein FlhA [Gammaproteobacteria bacterium]
MIANSQASSITAPGSFNGAGIGALVILVGMLAMIVLPMPPLLLDLLFTFSISFGIVILLSSVYTKRPLDFTIFPTIILMATLLRLALNVASTRVVLLEGHTGTDAAGAVIQAFGDFVVGGNYIVGIVVFAILVIINFVVVTKGAGRISEVSARFTLDSMPGKQMAIDADLNAGIIDQDEAKERRETIVQEADFYGSMDGASKFVRGDAIAGILILFINIIGGLLIGTIQHGLDVSEAAHNYTLLTIGDGLVAQIPALILSIAAAITVTRVSSATQSMGDQVMTQLFESPKPLAITAAVLGIMGVIPGMPNIVFLLMAAGAGYGAYMIAQRVAQPKIVEEDVVEAPVDAETQEISWQDVIPVDALGLEVGYRLIPLVDKNQGGQLLSRIRGIRKKLTQDLGFLIPPIHIRDNLDLTPNVYRVSLLGVTLAEAEIHPEMDLAINPGQVFGTLNGIPTKDPAFGLDAVWIEARQRDEAQTMGYTVVDASTVVATHITQLIQSHADELLGRDEVQQLLDTLESSAPKLVEELIPDIMPIGIVSRVLKNLLQEGVAIRDVRTIVETLAENGSKSQDPAVLTAMVRIALGRSIVQSISGISQELEVITLDPSLEQILQNSMQGPDQSGIALEPGLADRMLQSLITMTQRQEALGSAAVVLVSAAIRNLIARFVKHSIPNLKVLSYNEVPDNKQIKIVATVGANA